MGKTQDKFLKLLDLLNGCREKLYATYNLFVSNLEQSKSVKTELGLKYEQLLDLHSDFVQLSNSSKPAKTRIATIKRDSQQLKAEYDAQYNGIGDGMVSAEKCRKTYKHEVSLCCQTYGKLKEVGDASMIEKGYKQQVRLIRRILDKMEQIKVNFKGLKEEIKQQKQMFDELYGRFNNQAWEF